MPRIPANKPGMALMRGTVFSKGLIGLSQDLQSSSLYLVSIQAELMGCLAWQKGQEKTGVSSDIVKVLEMVDFYPILRLDFAILSSREKR